MATCKSPTHNAYGDAVEGLYIQTWMASRDLAKIMAEVETGADAKEKGRFLLNKEHRIDEVTERIAFGRSELADATANVNRHFDRGCKNLDTAAR